MNHYKDPTANEGIKLAAQVRCKKCNRILLVNKDAKGKVQILCPRCKEKGEYKL